jgi:hypothetical protein
MQDPRYWIQDAGYRMQDPGSMMHDGLRMARCLDFSTIK